MLKFQWKEYVFSTILLILALLFNKSLLPVILIVITGYLSGFLIFFSNKTYTDEQVKKIDAKTSSISLNINKTFQYTLSHENTKETDTQQVNNTDAQQVDNEENLEA